MALNEPVTKKSVFNLEFNPDGRLLIAACEDHSVICLDGFNGRIVKKIPNAHGNCVNVIKFLNDQYFVTGSDDTTIGVWDIRNLNQKVHNLIGHYGWIKNCELMGSHLVTFGIEDQIRAWDIHQYLSQAEKSLLDTSESQILMMSPEIMRIGIPNDESKLVLSLRSGALMLIHDLNLATFQTDFVDFDWSDLPTKIFKAYWSYKGALLELNESPEEETWDELFDEDEVDTGESPIDYLLMTGKLSFDGGKFRKITPFNRRQNRLEIISATGFDESIPMTIGFDPASKSLLTRTYGFNSESSFIYDISNQNANNNNNPSPNNAEITQAGFKIKAKELLKTNANEYFSPRIRGYVVESNFSSGIFKNPCFSNCGRIICSPYHHGVRIFDVRKVLQMTPETWNAHPVKKDFQPDLAVPLVNTHNDDVFVTCYSPTLPLFASGGADGRVVFYSPNL